MFSKVKLVKTIEINNEPSVARRVP